MLWKAADESNDITNFGWVIQDTIPIPAVAQGAPVPPELIKCQCKAQGKQCSTEACMCHINQHLACTSYCNCSGMTVAIRTLWDKVQTEEVQESIDAENEDYEEDAAIEDVAEEEPVEFADPEDDEFELEEF